MWAMRFHKNPIQTKKITKDHRNLWKKHENNLQETTSMWAQGITQTVVILLREFDIKSLKYCQKQIL